MRGIGVGFVIAVCSVVYPAAGFSQKAADLTKPAGKDWLTIGGDWHNTRFSALTQINRKNVKNLKGAWVTHLGSGLGQKYSFEGTPIVKDGVLYIATGNDDVFALDGKTGALIWEHRSGIEQNISTAPMPPRSLTRSMAFNTSLSPWGASRRRPLPQTAIWSGHFRCGAAPIAVSRSSRPHRRRRPE